MQQDEKSENLQEIARLKLRGIRKELDKAKSDIEMKIDRSKKCKKLLKRMLSFARFADTLEYKIVEQSIANFVNLLSEYFILANTSDSMNDMEHFEVMLVRMCRPLIKYPLEQILSLPLKLNYLILSSIVLDEPYSYTKVMIAIEEGESLERFTDFENYAINCVQQILLNYDEFLELIKNPRHRYVYWHALKSHLTPKMIIALCQYPDVRGYIIKLIKQNEQNKHNPINLDFLQTVPEVVALYDDDNDLSVAARAFGIYNERNDTAEFMPLLFTNDVFVYTQLAHRKFLISLWPNIYNNYLRSILNDPVRRKHDFVKSILASLLKQIDELQDFSVVFQYEILLFNRYDSFLAMVRSKNISLQVVNQVFNDYFFGRNAIQHNVALSIMKIFSNPKCNPDPISRVRANYYAAKLHMEKQEFTEANSHMMTLGDAADALDEEEHADIAMFLAIAKSPGDQQRHIEEMGKHRNYLDESQLVMQNLYVKDELVQTLDQMKLDLTKYLSQRNTNSFIYKLGFKNRQLSEAKNRLVSTISRNVDEAKLTLTNSNTSQEIMDIANKLTMLLAEAIKHNSAYFRQYGRVIDGPGTLGGQLAHAKNKLASFSEAIRGQAPANLLLAV